MYELAVESGFSAAHQLIEYEGACQRIHGHNWKVQVTIASEKLNKLGMVIDLYELETMLNECLQIFDHRIINEIAPFDKMNPTSENLAKYIFDYIKTRLPAQIFLKKVRLFETDNFSVTFTGD